MPENFKRNQTENRRKKRIHHEYHVPSSPIWNKKYIRCRLNLRMCTICQHKYGKKLIAPTNAVKLKACLLCSFVLFLSPLHSPSHLGPPLSRQVDRFVRQCVRRLVVLSIDMPDGPRNASGLQHLPHLQAVRVIRQK